MNKKLFYLLVFLMSLSLVGIIFVQGYWIKNTVSINEQQFSLNANETLFDIVENIEDREIQAYYFAFKRVSDSIGKSSELSLKEFFNANIDSDIKDTVLEASDVKSSDSLVFTNLVKDEVEKIRRIGKSDYSKVSDRRLKELMAMNSFEKAYILRAVQSYSVNIPLKERLTKFQVENAVQKALSEHDLGGVYEYGIYKNGIPTSLVSGDFDFQSKATYSLPLFSTEDSITDYTLFINLPKKNKVVLSSITLMSALSIIFTLIIIIAYTTALSQLIRQRQISEIKTDFINNMTHEFKTPIATMRLALDFLNNPKARGNETMLNKYLGMIGEENKRMNDQVENILQISRLEKNDLDISREPQLLHELLDDSVGHVQLIVEQRGGYIKKHFGALKSNVLANESHFTNVLVNLLENAVKYSPETPKVDIYTENVGSDILVKIRDQGLGMSKTIKNNIFKKFFRAHTGDLHDVKGHGLGLAYSKRIVEEHNGEITVESEKGKGSTFIIKLPLIKS